MFAKKKIFLKKKMRRKTELLIPLSFPSAGRRAPPDC